MRIEEVNQRILEGLSEEEQKAFKEGLKRLSADSGDDMRALRESVRRLHPEYTERQLDLFCGVKPKPTKLPPSRESYRPLTGWEHWTEVTADRDRQSLLAAIAYAYKDAKPNITEEESIAWTVKNEQRVADKAKEEGFGASTVKQRVDAIIAEDIEKEEEAELPAALKVKYPDWSSEKRAAWLTKHEAMIMSYKGLHPDWTGQQLILAVDTED